MSNNLKHRLQQAISQNEFVLFCQHISSIDKVSREETFVEILVRHEDEERNLVPPGAFLPWLEQEGLAAQFDRWVIGHVIAWYKAKGRNRPIRFSINVAAATLCDQTLPHFLADQLSLGSGRILCFEPQQGDVIELANQVRPIADSLRSLGCRIALGSLGPDIVSLEAIKSVPVDYAKIHRSLIRRLKEDDDAVRKVRSLNRLCQGVGIETIAEFVEDLETLPVLESIGINYVQGFAISKPIRLESLE